MKLNTSYEWNFENIYEFTRKDKAQFLINESKTLDKYRSFLGMFRVLGSDLLITSTPRRNARGGE